MSRLVSLYLRFNLEVTENSTRDHSIAVGRQQGKHDRVTHAPYVSAIDAKLLDFTSIPISIKLFLPELREMTLDNLPLLSNSSKQGCPRKFHTKVVFVLSFQNFNT